MRLSDAFLNRPFAHRGFHNRALGHIENSSSAIVAAIAAGYGIEIDVQLSKDGVAMVFHDETLDRLTPQSGLVCDYLATELQKIHLKDSQDMIPTLDQILGLVAGQAPLLIEIKDQTGDMSVSDGRLETATAKALRAYAGPVAVMSFNPHSIALMADFAPNLARGLTTSAYDYDDWAPLAPQICDHLRAIPDYDRTGACFISHEAGDLDRPRVAELRAQGAHIQCWTIKSQAAEQNARRFADNITFEQYAAKI
jgi:glycerophosphoryl diester phosphodiesterase